MKNIKKHLKLILKIMLILAIFTLIILDFCNIQNTSLSTSNIILLIILLIVIFVDNFDILQIGRFLKIKRTKTELTKENECFINQDLKNFKPILINNFKVTPIIKELTNFEHSKKHQSNFLTNNKDILNSQLILFNKYIQKYNMQDFTILKNVTIDFFNKDNCYFNFYVYKNANQNLVDIIYNTTLTNNLFLQIFKQLIFITKYNNYFKNKLKYVIIIKKTAKNVKNTLILSDFFKIFVKKQILEFNLI